MKLRKQKLGVIALVLAIILSSCNANQTQKGSGIGAVAGGVLGAIIGNNVGNGKNAAAGAAIGAAIGGVAGGVIGNKMDKQAREIEQSVPGATVERVGEGIRVVLGENTIRFGFDKSDLTATSKASLDKLVEILEKSDNQETNIGIYGYTDSKGSVEYNKKLSDRRAKSVSDYLISKGVPASRLTTVGFGVENPIGNNSTEQGRALNRRVEFSITANEKMKEQARKESK